jgi:benzoyl-CoA reductase/2-hydroxyglutaryl-CoA dehydratase subunit BcrC/BadD/HgdB
LAKNLKGKTRRPGVRETAEIFESFGEARRQGFIHVKSLKEQGYGVVGFFCSRVPVELFTAAGLVPVSLCPVSGETAGQAEHDLPKGLCPLVRAAYTAAFAGTCPYIYFSDLVVGETSCNGKTLMYRRLEKLKDVHVMKLPPTEQGDSARSLWLGEIRALRKKIEEKFRVKITGEKLRGAIRRRNRERALLKELCELSLAKPPPLTGLQQLRILHGAQFRFNHGEKVRELEETIDRIKGEYAGGKRAVPEGAPRILVTGCPGGAAERIVCLIEESGAVVVVYETCAGTGQYDRLISETGGPYRALRDYYLGTGCALAGSGPRRRELLKRLCAQFAVDGLIEMTLRFCHTYMAGTRGIGELAGELGLPFMSLELDGISGDTALLKDRVAAFIKPLGRGERFRKERTCW